MLRLAVDIGGTFTDLVLEEAGQSWSIKLLTTPAAPEAAVLEGTRQILALAGQRPEALGLVVHGTTLATNALIERKGARTALVTTQGFRNSIEIAWEHRFEQYDIYMERPEPLVPRRLRFGVAERVAADGAVLLPLDEAGAARASPPISAPPESKRSRSASCTASPTRRMSAAPARFSPRSCPGVAISLSCEVVPEIREYERASTTVANAYVQPLMAGYLGQLESGLRDAGVAGAAAADDVVGRHHHRRDGAALPGAAGRIRPGRRRDPGAQRWRPRMRPASAPSPSTWAAPPPSSPCSTTCELQRSRQFEVARAYRFVQGSGLPVRIPVIELVEIGAGGGSIARIDALGRIQVGPDSAGSVPGPGLLRPRRHRAHRDRRRRDARPARSRALRRRQRSRCIRDTAPRRRCRHRRTRSVPTPPAPRPASPRSSTRPWPAPPACTRSRTARTPPTAR